MARTNLAPTLPPVFTHEGGQSSPIKPEAELRRSVLACLLWENTFYEKGSDLAARIAGLVAKIEPGTVAALAIEARSKFKLRHVPLFLARELARRKGAGALVREVLPQIVQRADELAEFVSMYWKDGKQPLSAGVKKGLAAAFVKFDEYQLAKWDRANKVRLRDVLFLTHAKPRDEAQAELWKRLVANELATPDTWEVALSSGADKRETFERLLSERKLGGMATLQNLRNMVEAGVDAALIRERLAAGCGMALPFRFVTAARVAPSLEDAIEASMLKAVEELPQLPGKTGLLIDVSGSMDYPLSQKGETKRMDAAAGLAILLREKAEAVAVATFSTQLSIIPSRRGFALRDAIISSQPHSSTMLGAALMTLQTEARKTGWENLDRIVVITDEQAQDNVGAPFAPKGYIVNVGTYKNGVGYRAGWTHIDGWSERVVDYIREVEAG